MAYEGITPEGTKVNAKRYKEYQDYVIEQQTQGGSVVSYDEWASGQAGERVRGIQENNRKYF